MENEPWYKKCIRCKNRMFGICMADVTIKQFAENGSICPLWEEKTMEIKPCPFCGSEDVKYNSLAGCVMCKDCHSYGPNAVKEENAVKKWNAAPRKEDVEMEKNCGSCNYNQDGYCSAVPPYKSLQVDSHLCCTDWAAKESKSIPLTPSNSKGLEPFILEAKDELKYIQQKESTHNQMQQLAEEAAELAQAALKFNRMMGCGCYTPVNPKDARDAVIEETADVLLCLEAAFPHRPGNMGFYSNLARIYQEKAKRWAERLKEHDN